MTDEQIIEMAKKSGIPIANVPNLAFGRLESGVELLKTFAKLVAQHERERIFGELLKMHEIASSRHNYYLNAVLTIRARGES